MPSLINELIVEELSQVLEHSSAVILVDPTRLNAAESLDMRRKLFDIGAGVTLAKARLIKHCIGQEAADVINGSGSLAVVHGEDIAAVAKLLKEMVKGEKLAIRGAVAEGRGLGPDDALKLADLPDKHQVRAQLVKAIRMPAVRLAKVLRLPYTRLARALKAPYGRLARGLNAHKTKLEDG